MKRSLLFAAACLVLLFAFGATSASAAAAAPQPPAATAAAVGEAEKFVQASIDKGFAILNNTGVDATERQKQFRDFLFTLVDTKRIALFTLGPYVRGASDAQLNEFYTAYDNFVAALYQGYFDWYKGEALRVSPNSQARNADDVVVFADILGPNGERKYRVGFRVRHDNAGKTIVTDFQFEGAWLALNQRADYTAYMQQHRGNYAALTAELVKRTERFKEEWAPPKR